MTDAFLGANGAAVARSKAEASVLASASTTWPADISEGKLKLLQSRIYAMPPASIARGATAKERVYEAVRQMIEDLKETRKWLVAVAVRCTAVLFFEHRLAVLISLRRMVAVQEILRAGPSAEREKQIRRDSLASWHLAAPAPSAGVAHGFSDYIGDLEGF
ncbi:hypothetical protein LTR28_005790 [Elasticomyces elasticus]|nr:hypothetical protein LTR28_005790 [Elasticomyces elasticus]